MDWHIKTHKKSADVLLFSSLPGAFSRTLTRRLAGVGGQREFFFHEKLDLCNLNESFIINHRISVVGDKKTACNAVL